MTLPHFLGIGAMKAGTSLVHELLAEHPDVAMATDRKEVMFFDRHWERGVDWYEAHFDHTDGRVPGEVTPGYLFDPAAPGRIASVVPRVRLFAVFRDPVERAYSQYRFFVKEHAYKGSVEDFLAEHPNAVERGLYHAQLCRFSDHFDPDQLLVHLFDDLTEEPERVVRELFVHLGVDASFEPPSLGERRNVSERPRFHSLYALGRRGIGWLYDNDMAWVVARLKQTPVRKVFFTEKPMDGFPPMSDDTRRRLEDRYRPDAAALTEYGLWPRWIWLR